MGETDETEKKLESTHNISTRSGNISRSSLNIDPVYAKCTIWGSDRIQVKGKRIRDKLICKEKKSALKFIVHITITYWIDSQEIVVLFGSMP